MASSGLASSSFPAVSMVDDNMELSSDHGGLNANDDIDIDIDFTAGAADEDYMFDDPEPETDVEFKESFDTAPQAINDDIMEDDYNSSFQMEDIQDDDEQLEDIADETLDVPEMEVSNSKAPELGAPVRKDSSANVEGIVFDGPVQLQRSAFEDNSANMGVATSQAGSRRGSDTIQTLAPTTNHSPEPESVIPQAAKFTADSLGPPVNGVSHHSSSEQDTLAIESKEAHAKDGNKNLAEAVPSPNAADQGENEAVEEIVNQEQVQYDEMDASYAGIMVAYQDAQYSLFSTSEGQDTDSFFLTDRSIIQQPISSFLKALRGILQDELGGEDELCIAIDALRLEFGEKSAEIENVTFKELVNLYQQLLRNDGVESPEPLNFTLGTRPEFAKRFVGLLAGANEGKGLSELIPRDEESEIYDDAETSRDEYAQYDQSVDEIHSKDDYQYDIEGNGEENGEDHAQDAYRPEQDENDAQNEYVPEQDEINVQKEYFQEQDDIEENGEENGKDDAQDEYRPEQDENDDQDDDEHHSEHQENAASTLEFSEEHVERESSLDISLAPQGTDGAKNISTEITDENEEDETLPEEEIDITNPAPTVSGTDKTQHEQESEVSPRAVLEQADEDDLIDYSDDEPEDTKAKAKAPSPSSRNGNNRDFVEPCKKPKFCFCSACNEDLLVESFETLDSPSRATEHASGENTAAANAIDAPVTDTGDQAKGAVEHKPTDNTYDDAEIDFDFEDDQDTLENKQECSGEVQPNNDEPLPDNFDEYYTDFDGQEANGDETFEENASHDNGLEVGGQDFPESENLRIITSVNGEIASLKSAGTSPLEEVSAESVTVNGDTGDLDEIDYDEDDLTTDMAKDSGISGSHESQPILESAKTEVIDEIDYDDDDDDIGVVTPPAPVVNKSQQISSSTPGKRQRSDSMSEGAEGEENQEAKRVRS